MKKIIAFIALAMAFCSAFSYTVIVDNDGTLKAPNANTFKSANGILGASDFSKVQLFFDTTPSLNIQSPLSATSASPYGRTVTINTPYYLYNGKRTAVTASNGTAYKVSYTISGLKVNFCYWSDFEFKAIRRSDNELVYWYSTQAGATSEAYTTHSAVDTNAVCYFTVAGSGINEDGRNWILRDSTSRPSIYQQASTDVYDFQNGDIGGVVIEPNLSGTTRGGTSIRTIFENPDDYYFVYIRIDPVYGVEKGYHGRAIWRPYNQAIRYK